MKIDFKKTLKSYIAKRDVIDIIKVPTLQYIVIDGQGDPNIAKEYKDAIEVLYPIAYSLKFMSKLELEKDYVVPPLEGLWWADDMNMFTESKDKSEWRWTAMIMTPDWITHDMFDSAKQKVATKGDYPGLNKTRLETLKEDTCIQTLYVGSYSNEGPVIAKMHKDFMPANNLKPTGKHHEIYLSDPRKVAVDKLRTIIRQPVQKI